MWRNSAAGLHADFLFSNEARQIKGAEGDRMLPEEVMCWPFDQHISWPLDTTLKSAVLGKQANQP